MRNIVIPGVRWRTEGRQELTNRAYRRRVVAVDELGLGDVAEDASISAVGLPQERAVSSAP